ncbi:MAG: M48 family metalloprotease, partial [Acidobacteria bacterium]|nr:M48 family metalloprotease [Acidobacteriota bacterium]
PRYPYSFTVANYREINAFALPGGPIWIHRGAIEAAQNEAQLAGVLAHEVAHLANRHAAEQLSNMMIANFGLSLLQAILGSGKGATTAQIAAQFITTGTFLKFSRDHEREADRTGVDIMRRAGYDPRGMIEFLQGLRERARRDPSGVEVFLSTHPSPSNRIELLEAQMTSRGGRRDSARFRQIRQHLRRLPPARSMPRR